MILSYFPYELMLANPSKATSRKGFLIRLQDRDDQFGYSDLMPWPEFGEPNYAVFLSQLNTLKDLEGNKFQSSLEAVHPVLRIAVQNAKLDLQSRKHQDFLAHEISEVENNALLGQTELSSANIAAPSTAVVKLKLGPDYQQVLKSLTLNEWVREKLFRFDFNACLSFAEARLAVKWIQEHFKNRIQYIEDPCKFDFEVWRELNDILPLAADWQFQIDQPFCYQYVIIKPARQDWKGMAQFCQQNELKFTVTSSMDHSIGILWSLRVAAELKLKFPGLAQVAGCDTTRQYQQDLPMNPVLVSSAGQVRFNSQDKLNIENFLASIDWIKVK